MNERTNERTNESPPVFYRTFSPLGPLPCFLSLQFIIMQSRVKEIMQSNDHIFPLGDLFYRILSLWGCCSASPDSIQKLYNAENGIYCCWAADSIKISFLRPGISLLTRGLLSDFIPLGPLPCSPHSKGIANYSLLLAVQKSDWTKIMINSKK